MTIDHDLLRRGDEGGNPGNDDLCCWGVPSGYVTPDGIAARMCDDTCECNECVTQRSIVNADRTTSEYPCDACGAMVTDREFELFHQQGPCLS